MRASFSVPYAIAARTAAAIAAITPQSASSKLGRSFAARRNILDRYRTWSNAHRDRARPLIWLHAASVGESLMAQPLIAAVRRALPNYQIALTYYSPSAASRAPSLGADFTDFLPFDTRDAANAVIDALAPTALVYTKGDVWPTLTEVAAARGVKLGLISAAMTFRSRRASGFAASMTRDAYRSLDLIGAASDDDARAIVSAGAISAHVRVTGDTRYDQAWARARDAGANRELAARLASYALPTLVAGSTWPVDEAVLLPAWSNVVKSYPTARFVIAPHEPTAAACSAIFAWARNNKLHAASLDAARGDERVIVVDRMGALADLYVAGTIAYVGGAFHAAGLHSLVEPAVFGVPIIIGPLNESSRDARMMLAAGGAVSVADRDGMTRAIERLFYEADVRTSMADALRFVVTSELGAAERSFEVVRALLRPVKEKPLDQVNT